MTQLIVYFIILCFLLVGCTDESLSSAVEFSESARVSHSLANHLLVVAGSHLAHTSIHAVVLPVGRVLCVG